MEKDIVLNSYRVTFFEKLLFFKYGAAKPLSGKHIRLLVVADTHNVFPGEAVKGAFRYGVDACIILGDHTYKDIYQLIQAAPPGMKIYGVLGNHDNPDMFNHFSNKWPDIMDISRKVVTVNGIRIAGMGGTLRYKNEQPGFNTQRDSVKFAKSVPEAYILIGHAAPVSFDHSRVHSGLDGSLWYLYKHHIPYMLYGHNHDVRPMKSVLLNGTNALCVYRAAVFEIGDEK